MVRMAFSVGQCVLSAPTAFVLDGSHGSSSGRTLWWQRGTSRPCCCPAPLRLRPALEFRMSWCRMSVFLIMGISVFSFLVFCLAEKSHPNWIGTCWQLWRVWTWTHSGTQPSTGGRAPSCASPRRTDRGQWACSVTCLMWGVLVAGFRTVWF